MRHLASLPDAVQAENFGDYLTGLGIPNSREETGGNWAIWVEREEQLDQARKELEQFQHEPGAAKYQKAAQSARAFEAAQEQLARRLAKNFVNVRLQHSEGDRGAQQTFPATIVLVAVCLLVALISQLGSDTGRIDGFFFLPAKTPYYGDAVYIVSHFGIRNWMQVLWNEMEVIRQGQVWRLVTPIFIHFGVLHLLFNMWWLWDLGRLIERRRGTVFFVILVLVSAVISNLGEFAWTGAGNAGGMSGVIYALFGYVWMKGLLQPEQRLGIHQQVVWIMLAWLLLCMTGMLGPIGNAAHVVGLIVGVVFGVTPWTFLRLRREIRSRAREGNSEL